MPGEWDEMLPSETPVPAKATQGQLNNVEHVRVPYLAEVQRLPELERGFEVVKLLIKLREISKDTRLGEKLDLAMRAMSSA